MKVKRVKTPVQYEFVEMPTPWFYAHYLDYSTIYGMITEDKHYQISLRNGLDSKAEITMEVEDTEEGDSCYFTEDYRADPKDFRDALWAAERCIHAMKEKLNNEIAD